MSTGNIILLVVLVALLVLYPVLMMRRNKQEQAKQQQLVSSLKVGEYVLTYSGIFGKISEMMEKEIGKFVVIETGEKKKSYVTVSENAIYSVVNNNPKVYGTDGEEIKPEVLAEESVEAPQEIVVDETEQAEKSEPKAKKSKKGKSE